MGQGAPEVMMAWLLSTAFFGALVGSCELIGRYRDAPLEAVRNPAAIFYILVNMMAAAMAYVVIVRFDWGFGASAPTKSLVQAAVAGFGAMAFFRSSLFTMRVGETDVAVGPAVLFQILLFATDRGVDRTRGQARSDVAAVIMSGVSFALAKEALPNFCFELLQNVPLAEQQSFRQVVDALASKPPSSMGDSVKALSLGLMLMNVVGRQVLRTAVGALGERIQGPSALELPVLERLQSVEFTKAFPILIEVCFVMSKYGTAAEQSGRQEVVMAVGRRLLDNPTVDNATKVIILALSLQQGVGNAVLLSALAQLDLSLSDGAGRRTAPKVPLPEDDPRAAADKVVPLRPDDTAERI